MIKNTHFYKLLVIPNFRNFWFVQTFMLVAMQFYFLSLAWLTIDFTNSTMILGTLLTIASIPRLILVPIGGVLFDNLSPKKLLVANISILVTSTIIFTGILFWFPVQTWMLVLFAIFFGITSALFLPTTFALIPKLVPKEYLQSANSFSQLSMQLSNTFGPAIAGVLIALYGVTAVYSTMSIFFIISLVFSFLLKNIGVDVKKEGQNLTIRSLSKDIMGGLKIVNKNKLILLLIVISALLNLSIVGPQQIGLPYIANQTLDGGAKNLGFLMSSLGLGTLIGVFIIGFFKKIKSKSVMSMIITILLGVFWSFVGFFPQHLYVIASFLLMSGICVGILNVLVVTLIQLQSPADAIGRVMSLQLLGSTGIQPITFLIVGWLLGVVSPAVLFLLSGIILVITAGISLCFKRIRKPNANEGEQSEILDLLKQLEDLRGDVEKGVSQGDAIWAIEMCQETVANKYLDGHNNWRRMINR
ncbi:MFS transporter [Virgibacillus sp. 179-BFC.A HS]|uniref:MFS transporter n=1 Tax=Tigheibacillus jepli TaxID=3035914 RepID=A0ABU5CFX9_9BACI|nr:MFS transporter [Virgibacillus sp. 179-BFC.A HS]MDY0404455.1 MFS transporter [Virgibacillus sp. 179-BFC.A HS]